MKNLIQVLSCNKKSYTYCNSKQTFCKQTVHNNGKRIFETILTEYKTNKVRLYGPNCGGLRRRRECLNFFNITSTEGSIIDNAIYPSLFKAYRMKSPFEVNNGTPLLM